MGIGAEAVIKIGMEGEAEFASFYTKFLHFKAAADDTPEAWQRVSASAEVARQKYKGVSDQAERHADAANQAADRLSGLRQNIENAARGMVRLERASVGVAKNIGEATLSILKWAGIAGIVGGILGGAGSILAVDRFASRVSSARTGAMGVGSSPGRQRAADIAYSRFVGGGFSSRVADLQHDANSVAALKRLLPGMSTAQIANADPNDLIGPLIEAGRQRARNTPKGQLFNDPALNGIFSREQINTLASGDISDKEVGEARTRYETDKTRLEYKDSKVWADFERTIEESKSKIQAAFISRLSGLADPLGKLTDSATRFATKLIESKLAEDIIDRVASGMEWLADNIGKPEFQRKMGRFFTRVEELAKNIGALAKGAVDFISWFTDISGTKAEAQPNNRGVGSGGRQRFMNRMPHDNPNFVQQGHETKGARRDFMRRMPDYKGSNPPDEGGKAYGWWTPGREQHIYDRLREGGLTDLAARALIARGKYVESTQAGSEAENRGHWGIWQHSRDRAGNLYGDPDVDKQTDLLLKEFRTTEKAAAKRLMDAKTPAEAARAVGSAERSDGFDPRNPGAGDNYNTKVERGIAGVRAVNPDTQPKPDAAPQAKIKISQAAGNNPADAAAKLGTGAHQ